MGLIRFGFKALKYFLIFSLGYYMGGGCENISMGNELEKNITYSKSPYYQSVDKKVMENITQLNGLEKRLNLNYSTTKE